MIGCNLYLALPLIKVEAPISHSIPRFAQYTVPTRVTRNTQTHRFARPLPSKNVPRMFRRNRYPILPPIQAKREIGDKTRNR
jgi:hypothetical protein